MHWRRPIRGSDALSGVAANNDPVLAEEVRQMREQNGHAMNAFLAPLYQGDAFRGRLYRCRRCQLADADGTDSVALQHGRTAVRDTAGRMSPVTVQRSDIKRQYMRERCWLQRRLIFTGIRRSF